MKNLNSLSMKPDPNNPGASRRIDANKRLFAMLESKAHSSHTAHR
jgi:hypothetical protein